MYLLQLTRRFFINNAIVLKKIYLNKYISTQKIMLFDLFISDHQVCQNHDSQRRLLTPVKNQFDLILPGFSVKFELVSLKSFKLL